MKRFHYLLFAIAITAINFNSYAQIAHKGNVTQIQILNNVVKSVMLYTANGGQFKCSYTYDNNGKILVELVERLLTGQWLSDQRFTNTYDDKGNLLINFREMWINGAWVEKYRSSYVYDSKANKLSFLYEQFSNGKWYPLTRNTYTYDSKGNQLTDLTERIVSGKLDNYVRKTWTYDAEGNKLSLLQEQYTAGQWGISSKADYIYDSKGNQLSEIFQKFTFGQYYYDRRRLKTYDAKGNNLTWTDEYWQNNDWVIEQKEIYSYDENNNQLSYTYEHWNSPTEMDWAERDTITYNANGKELTWKWRELVGTEWIERERSTCTYNSYGNLYTRIHEYLEAGQWINYDHVQGIKFKDIRGNEFIYACYKIEITYENEVGVKSEEPIAINLFPNPATDFIEIAYDMSFLRMQESEIGIYNMLGECVLKVEQASSPVQRIDVSGLTEGIYFIRIGEITKKFVKL